MRKHRKLISCSYVKEMKCWNNLENDEFQPKSNDDMMQCVTCNKSSLFAPRLKTLENKETTNIIVEQEFFSQCMLKWKTLILSYIKLKSIQCIWIDINSIPIQQLYSNSIKDNWYANWWKMYSIYSFEYVIGKNIQYTNMKRHLSMLLHLWMN
jgi:hypothetical protein